MIQYNNEYSMIAFHRSLLLIELFALLRIDFVVVNLFNVKLKTYHDDNGVIE